MIPGSGDFFYSRIDQIIDLRHPRCTRLAAALAGGPRALVSSLAREVKNGGNPPLEPRGLEVEFFPKEEVLHEKVKIYG